MTGGTWVDGKPIYRKVIQNPIKDAVLATNVDELINFVFKRSYSSSDTSFEYYDGNNEYNFTLWDNQNGDLLFTQVSSMYDAIHYWLIIEYTKTTD